MENTTLIGMTDYVLKQNVSSNKESYETTFDRIVEYAKFLKQPIKLGMFIPCDEDDNALIDPEIIAKENGVWLFNHTFSHNGYQKNLGVYRQEFEVAISRILFLGFEIKEYPDAVKGEITKVIKHKSCYAAHFINDEWKLGVGLSMIEDLVPDNLTLTESKAKELGLI